MSAAKRALGPWPFIIVAVIACALGILGTVLVQRSLAPSVRLDTATVSEQLEKCEDLATAKLDYRGLAKYEQGDIDFINKKAFTMIYDASVRAGVDLSKARVSVSGRDVSIELPAATVQAIEVDPDSLQFYDEKYALFNWQDRSDTVEALKLAQKDAEAKVDEAGLISQAESHAKDVVETLLAPFTGENGYRVTVTVAQA